MQFNYGVSFRYSAFILMTKTKIERTEKNNASDFLNIVTFHSKDVKSPPNGL